LDRDNESIEAQHPISLDQSDNQKFEGYDNEEILNQLRSSSVSGNIDSIEPEAQSIVSHLTEQKDALRAIAAHRRLNH